MAKRFFIVHGWGGRPDTGWLGLLRKEIEKRGYSVRSPAMPGSQAPSVGEWVGTLSRAVGTPDGDCYFAGFSLGCITILRYLETLEPSNKVGGSVLVAGFSDDIGFAELSDFFSQPLDWKLIRSRCPRFYALFSDNDPYVPLSQEKLFREKLGAETSVQKGMGHFNTLHGEQLRMVLEPLLRMAE